MGVCVAFLWRHHNHQHLALWWGINTLFSLWRIAHWHHTKSNTPATIEAAENWLRGITVASAIGGCIWGFGAFIFIYSSDIATSVFFLLTILSVANGGVISYAAHLPAGLAFAVPIAVSAAARLAYADFDFAYLVAVGSIVALGFMFIVGRNYASAVNEAISLHVENESLLSESNHQKKIAEQANLEKSRFFAAISHDLSQPLYAMGLVLESLGERLEKKDQQQLFGDLSRMHDAVTDMFRAALDVANLDSASVSVKQRSFELKHVVESVCAEFLPQASAKGIEIVVHGGEQSVHTDRLLLTRILRNLLSNAIKFSDGGFANIRYSSAGNSVLIEVEDDGPGIPEDALPSIFAEYYQVQKRARNDSEGFGLGLAVVDRLCRLLDIELTVDSKLGSGAKFSLRVPAGQPEKAISAEERRLVTQFGGLHVMVIDDDPEIRRSLDRLLTEHECLVTSSSAGEKALAQLNADQRPVDLLICDYQLNDGNNGFDEIIFIREHLDPVLPAILITGDTDPGIFNKAREEALPLLRKPVKTTELFQTILDTV